MDLFARAIESVRLEADAERVVLVGHSMGTPVVVQYARLYPQHVAAMVFVDGIVTIGTIGPTGGRRPEKRMAGPEGAKAREAMIRRSPEPAIF
jgi:pimeloyl-ACP methyl ester carboxylesterase